MMSRLKFTSKLLGLACAAGLCLGATFTWTDGGGDHDWDTADNWSIIGVGLCPYPCSGSDDAIFPTSAGGWTCRLVTESIEDLSIAGSVEFGSADPNDPNGVTLTVDSLSIGSPSGSSALEVEVTENATIQVLENP